MSDQPRIPISFSFKGNEAMYRFIDKILMKYSPVVIDLSIKVENSVGIVQVMSDTEWIDTLEKFYESVKPINVTHHQSSYYHALTQDIRRDVMGI